MRHAGCFVRRINKIETLTKSIKQLCQGIVAMPGGIDSPVGISGIAIDSRKVRPGDLFIAISGYSSDGHSFIDIAVQKGASAIIVEKDVGIREIPVFRVKNSREAAAVLSHRFFDEPSKDMKILGITGTNGKTTVAFLLESIFKSAGYKTGLLGTLLYRWGAQEMTAVRTTPDSVELNHLLWKMKQDGVQTVCMEVSSHALALDRVAGIIFQGALFTNLSRDHLDFHETLREYCQTKSKLFSLLASTGVGVINGDDGASRHMVQASRGRTILYGKNKSGVDYSIKAIDKQGKQSAVTIDHQGEMHHFITSLVGNFNMMNVTAAAVMGLEMGINEEDIRQGIAAIDTIKGRMERVEVDKDTLILIDYAHSPDALENALKAARDLTSKRLFVVFGCGGDRDKGKRKEMGQIAGELADAVILTSDNPRNEDPETILTDILEGIESKQHVNLLVDRGEAIRRTLDQAREGDTVLIAGKGHEKYQEIGSMKRPFDDREVVETYFQSREEA
jgi:UDP-N-acetylmuramoyl-L-alanyl-D-glutamate--2,6-diaminopimelate ligase